MVHEWILINVLFFVSLIEHKIFILLKPFWKLLGHPWLADTKTGRRLLQLTATSFVSVSVSTDMLSQGAIYAELVFDIWRLFRGWIHMWCQVRARMKMQMLSILKTNNPTITGDNTANLFPLRRIGTAEPPNCSSFTRITFRWNGIFAWKVFLSVAPLDATKFGWYIGTEKRRKKTNYGCTFLVIFKTMKPIASSPWVTA